MRTITGLGPAVINVFEVTVDGKPVTTWDAVMVAFGIDVASAKGKYSIPVPGSYIPTGPTQPWLWLESPPEARAALVKNSQRVNIKLVYCSVYDECWERSGAGEPKAVAKQEAKIQFGASQGWRDSFSNIK